MNHDLDQQAGETGIRQYIQWWLQVLALRALWSLVRCMSPARASATGWRLMAWLGPRSKKQRHVLANLKMVCPDKTDAEIERLGREVWGNIGAVFAEFTQLEKYTDPQRNRGYFEVVNNTGRADFFDKPRPCVFVSVHLASWELVGYFGNLAGGMDAIYNRQPNPWLEKIVQRRRRLLGCGYVDKANSARKLLGVLKGGRSVGLLVDVRIDGGQLVPFCGADATVTTMPAWLSLRAGCDIVPIQIERLPGARFRAIFHPPLRTELADGESRDQAVLRVTRAINGVAEGWVKAHPQHWLCTKRRWPKEIMKARGVYAD